MGVLMIVLSPPRRASWRTTSPENDLLTAPNQSIALFGSTPHGVRRRGRAIVPLRARRRSPQRSSRIGMGLIRGSSDNWRAMKRRVAELEWSITSLRSKLRLSEVVKAEKQRPHPAARGRGRNGRREPRQVETDRPRQTSVSVCVVLVRRHRLAGRALPLALLGRAASRVILAIAPDVFGDRTAAREPM